MVFAGAAAAPKLKDAPAAVAAFSGAAGVCPNVKAFVDVAEVSWSFAPNERPEPAAWEGAELPNEKPGLLSVFNAFAESGLLALLPPKLKLGVVEELVGAEEFAIDVAVLPKLNAGLLSGGLSVESVVFAPPKAAAPAPN